MMHAKRDLRAVPDSRGGMKREHAPGRAGARGRACRWTPSPAAKDPPFATGKVRENLPFELRNVKVADGGRSIEGVGIVRFDMDRGDTKPAVIAILKVVKEKFPGAKQIALGLSPSVDCPTLKIAEATWDNGRVTLKYGIPTLGQIEAPNSRIGAGDRQMLLLNRNGACQIRTYRLSSEAN